jgi:hypothetical protein
MLDWLGRHVVYEGNKPTLLFDHGFVNTYSFAENPTRRKSLQNLIDCNLDFLQVMPFWIPFGQ